MSVRVPNITTGNIPRASDYYILNISTRNCSQRGYTHTVEFYFVKFEGKLKDRFFGGELVGCKCIYKRN